MTEHTFFSYSIDDIFAEMEKLAQLQREHAEQILAEIITKYDFEIVQKYETIDALWGLEHRKITDDDIAALKDGKCLYCDNGEYAQIISYKEEK